MFYKTIALSFLMLSNMVQAEACSNIPADLTAQKKRPVMVVSELDENNDFIALAISLTNQHLIQGSLPKAS